MAQRQGGSSGMGSPLGVEGAAAAVDKAFDAKAAGGSRLLALALVVVVVVVLVLVLKLPMLMLVLSLVLVVVLVGMLVLMAMLVVAGSAVVVLVPVGAMAVLVPVLVVSVAVALVVVGVAAGVPLAAAGAARLCLTGLAALVPMLVCLLAFRVLRLLQRPGSCHSAPAAAQQAGSGWWLSRVQARHRTGTWHLAAAAAPALHS